VRIEVHGGQGAAKSPEGLLLRTDLLVGIGLNSPEGTTELGGTNWPTSRRNYVIIPSVQVETIWEKGYHLARRRDPVRHSPPFKGRGRGGVCNVSNILSAKSGGEEVSEKSAGEEWAAKKWQHRALLTLQTPPLTPPLEGRGWLRIELCGGQGTAKSPEGKTKLG